MKKIVIILLHLSCVHGMYRIQNAGQAGSGFIAVYDQNTNKSALVNGYSDTENDNGHCAQGAISAKPLTIIIPENPAKFGYINADCIANESGTINYNPLCSMYCGGPVTDGESIAVQAVPDYANCSVTQTPNTVAITNMPDYGTIYCPQQKTATVHVSPLCQQLGAYFKENFANDATIKLVEYAQCDPGELSYCSISFVPSKPFSVSINTDYLTGINHAVPGLCNKQSVCSMTMSNLSTNSCQLNIMSPFYGTGINALNNWLSNNATNIFNPQPFEYIPSLPNGYFGNCTNLPESVIVDIKNQTFDTAEDAKDTLVNNRLRFLKNRVDFYKTRYEATKLPGYLNQMKRYEKRYYQEYFTLNKTASANWGAYIAEQANNYFLCTSGYSTDATTGNIQVTYTCSTQGYNPNYTCNYVYQATGAANNANVPFVLQTAYCSFPLDSIVFQSPELGGADFNCGFCGRAELSSVGNNTQDAGIESVYGNAGLLFPFKTAGLGFNPTCPSGFISRLDTSTTPSANLTIYNTLNSPVQVVYNKVWGNVGYPQTTLGGGLQTYQALAQSANPILTGNFWSNGVLAGTCNASNPTTSATCLGIKPGSIENFDGAYAFGISSSLTNKTLTYVGTGNTSMQCTPQNPSCTFADAQAEQQVVQASATNTLYTISNQGQKSSGYVALYDTNAQNSILIGGYANADSDNGHCAQGILNNQELTLVIPENLWGFGYVNAECTAATQGNTKYNPLCVAYCGGTITEGSVVEQTTLNYQACTPNEQLNAQKIMINGQAMYCPIQTTVNHLHVSPLCQNIGAYIKNNFANQDATNFKITEYAACKEGETSYCAVTFVPKSTSFRLAVNTDTFNGPSLPATCANTTCSLATSTGKDSCSFAIQDATYGAGLTALNGWYTKNSATLMNNTVSMPTATYTCAGKSSACSGTYSLDEKGNLIAVYSCSTSTTPSYICNFVYYLPQGASAFTLAGSSCSFEINNTMIQSPTVGDADFNCGFCGVAEWHSVGNNRVNVPLESAYGTAGELFPFSTQGNNPTCMNGFIAQLIPEKIYNNQEVSNIFQESNGIFAYNFSGKPYTLSIGYATTSVWPTVTVQDGCQLLYMKGDVINSLAFNNHPSLWAKVALGSWPFLNQQGWAYAGASLSRTNQELYAINAPFGKTFNCALGSGCSDITSTVGINWQGLGLMQEAPSCTQNKAVI